MAQSKNSAGRKKSGGQKYKVSDKKKAGAKESRRSTAEELRERRRNSAAAQIMPFIVGLLALVLFVFIYFPDLSGTVGEAVGKFFKGVFAGGAYTVPFIALVIALRWRKDAEERQNGARVACGFGIVTLSSMLLHIFAGGEHVLTPGVLYSDGTEIRGGGFLGGLIGELLWRAIKVCMPILAIAGLLILIPLLFGLTPRGVYVMIAYNLKMAKERRESAADEREILRRDRRDRAEDEYSAVVATGKYPPSQMTLDEDVHPKSKSAKKSKEDFVADVPMPDGDKYEDIAPEVDESIFASALREREEESDALTDGRISDKIESYDADTDADNADSAEAEDVPEIEVAPPVATVQADDGATSGDDRVDLSQIFTDPDDEQLLSMLNEKFLGEDDSADDADTDLSFIREKIGDGTDSAGSDDEPPFDMAPPEPEVAPYRFPPIDLLTPDNSKKDPGVREELLENAKKLVETLRSFNVKTKIVDVSRGPTITRYELMPEAGTKVRTISNLTDDIALSFATTGVRIEAPIPGKSAVGIEVPNKTSATVHLRTLLEDRRFSDAQSKITAALGEDVAGEAIYLDIAKMPHLLIAGATGMGKSVCINSLIVSLLFKATPDEVKLILIDPKKVELSIYNGLPHLLVPVVSDPKKAAGSLSWAVSEMERRFNLIEEAGVGVLLYYNAGAAADPSRTPLPQIVIIIDELADLMMTAPDDVESSICRLAQKARAAGMHLIIGTQRPSVDVITGLLKSNIPSRIAFTVASQVDSRTIIDRAGAERLIGRGDMLYNQLGAAKPIRVQGAFVSESEVEAITEFIKNANSEKNDGYSEDVIEQIEREAEKCGSSKKHIADAGDDAGDEDPMLRQAIELAVESRKISTSLIQRRLSLGYGRAAKLIDRMEQLGYVSAPDGQKPRDVLISKEEFMEMVLKDTD